MLPSTYSSIIIFLTVLLIFTFAVIESTFIFKNASPLFFHNNYYQLHRNARFTNPLVQYSINHWVSSNQNYIPLAQPFSSVRISYPGMVGSMTTSSTHHPSSWSQQSSQLYPYLAKPFQKLCQTGHHKGFYVGRSKDHKNCYYLCPDSTTRIPTSSYGVTYMCCSPYHALDFQHKICFPTIQSQYGHYGPLQERPFLPSNPTRPLLPSSSTTSTCVEGTMKAHPSDCHRYYRCMFRSIFLELSCPFDFNWNPKWQVCDANYDCTNFTTHFPPTVPLKPIWATRTRHPTFRNWETPIKNHQRPFKNYWSTKNTNICNDNRWQTKNKDNPTKNIQPECTEQEPIQQDENEVPFINGIQPKSGPSIKNKKTSIKTGTTHKRWYEKGYKYVFPENKKLPGHKLEFSQNKIDQGKNKPKFWWKPTRRPSPSTTTKLTKTTVFDSTTTIEKSNQIPKKIPQQESDDFDKHFVIDDDKDDQGQIAANTSPTTTDSRPSTIDNDDNRSEQEPTKEIAAHYSQTSSTTNPDTILIAIESTTIDPTVDIMIANNDTTTTPSNGDGEQQSQINYDEEHISTTSVVPSALELPAQEPLVETTVMTSTPASVWTTMEPKKPLVFEENSKCYEPTARYKDDEDCQCFYECQFNKRLTRNCCPEGLFFNQIDYEPSNGNVHVNGTSAAIYEIDLIEPMEEFETEPEQHSYCDLPENIECKTIIQ